ncbi:MAG TPA: hypothetical protein VFZ61_03880 [Polyangiales bacterium]
MRRAVLLATCGAAWAVCTLLEGLFVPAAVVYAWAHDTRRDAARGVRAALLVLCVGLVACADAHERIEGLPLYVHLCDGMSEADQYAWGESAGVINAERGELVVMVGHGPVPDRCGAVSVCADRALTAGVEWSGTCVISMRYAADSAAGSQDALEALLDEVPHE